MEERYAQLLNTLSNALSPEHMAQAEKTAERLHEALVTGPRPGKPLHEYTVALLFGGGKDSSWTLAYTRLVQLKMLETYGDTFVLKSYTGRHPGMQKPVLDNIARAYAALGMDADDHYAQTRLIDNDRVLPFSIIKERPDSPLAAMPEEVIALNREDVLMNGHRFAADARRTFCDCCNRNLANWIGVAASDISVGGGSDLLITGDSPEERKSYGKWIRQLSHKMEAPRRRGGYGDVEKMLMEVDGIAKEHTQLVYGDDAEALQKRHVHFGGTHNTRFFSIFQEAEYKAEDHLSFLKDFLHFRFDSPMSSFTETDCGNPALMAHLYGLRAEKLFGATYAEGVREYARYAIELMGTKKMPQELIEAMKERYGSDEAIAERRKEAGQYAREAYDLSEEQLTTMIYAPFTGQGANLHTFLEREHAELLPQEDDIHRMLAGDDRISGKAGLEKTLSDMSGLPLKRLRQCYAVELVRNPLVEAHQTDELGKKLQLMGIGDPHQAEIISTLNVLHRPVKTVITGR